MLNATASWLAERDAPPAGVERAAPSELAGSALFANTSLESLEDLLEACPVRPLAEHEILLAPGQVNDALYLLLSGRLRVHLESPDGVPVGFVEPGETVGELSLLDQQPVTEYVVADMPSRVLAVPQEIFWTLIHASPACAANLLVSLAARLRRRHTVVAENWRLQQHYRRQAGTDELTGLPNRRGLEELLRRQMQRASMNGEPLALILLDVDRFKRYNDEFGPLAGDRALCAIAQALQNSVRPTDRVGRIGGDEFAVLLPTTDRRGARAAAERIRRIVQETLITLPDDSLLPPVTVSLGIAQMEPFSAPEALLERAERALQRAKRQGRGGVAD